MGRTRSPHAMANLAGHTCTAAGLTTKTAESWKSHCLLTFSSPCMAAWSHLLDTRTAPSQTAHDNSSLKVPLGVCVAARSAPNRPRVHSCSVSSGPIPRVAATDSDQAGSSELVATPGRLKQRTDCLAQGGGAITWGYVHSRDAVDDRVEHAADGGGDYRHAARHGLQRHGAE